MQNELQQIITSLQSIYPISTALIDALQLHSEVITVAKKSILVKEEETVKYLYVIHSGLLRSYYTQDGIEITSNFIADKDVLFCLQSFYHNKPDDFFVEALEDCVVARILFTDFNQLLNEHLELNYIARVLAHQYIMHTDKRLYLLRKMPMKERWNFFNEQFEHLVQRISLGHIATYLGMNLETLSRVRKN
jgi:CRP/FNR family transcriptional regulator, anaerobic regulatory protein